ncbi:MAG: alpha/beta fold hydrolase [Gammaproteobacteria bacterium]|nr:alpha/beta fold hydrolase [Gammaproteobacteria bacterium]
MSPLELHAEITGEGPPVVILHGLFGSSRNWAGVARSLAPRHRVWALDARNHGQSPHSSAMDYRVMAADVARFLERHSLQGVTLVGHSMGGKTAMTLALLDDTRLARLIVVDIAPLAYDDEHTAIVDAMLGLPLTEVKRRGDADRLLAAAVPDPEIRLFLLQNLRFEHGTTTWRLNLPALRAGMKNLVGELPVAPDARSGKPAYFIRGGRSTRVADGAPAASIAPHFPRAALLTIPDAGHWPHAEQPAAFMALLGEILAGP